MNETKEEIFCYWLGYHLRSLYDAFAFFALVLLFAAVILGIVRILTR